MNCEIFWSIFIGSLFHFVPQISGNDVSTKEICDFVNTVDLRGRNMYYDGTYGYDDILIPSEQQAYYDYELRFQGEKVKVPKHLRGCACKKRPCAKLCCSRDQFFNKTTKQCEKITPEMKVSWEVELLSDDVESVNISKKFTLQIGLPCDEPNTLDPNRDKFLLKEVSKYNIGASFQNFYVINKRDLLLLFLQQRLYIDSINIFSLRSYFENKEMHTHMRLAIIVIENN